MMKLKLIILGTISCLVSCLSVEPKGLDQQQAALESVYLACASSEIFTKSDIEEAINNGGNNLDRACKKSFQLIDISQLSLEIKVNDFREAVDPFKEISDQLLVLNSSGSSKTISNEVFIKIPENSQYTREELKIFGKNINESFVDLKASLIKEYPIGFTIDYSGSMYEEDIAYALTWINKIQALDKHTGVSLVEFSDSVYTKSNSSGLGPISFNSNIDRESTALYDAWATSLKNLNKEKSFAINLVVSDGAENNSNDYNQEELLDLIESSNVFNLVFASGFVSKSELNK